MKNDLLCSADKRVLWLSRTYQGSIHDKKIIDEQPLNLPSGNTLWQDTGFLAHKPKNVTVRMPTKKPKGKQLSHTQKEENRKTEYFPILVEHAIASVKERFRCRKFRFDDLVMIIACGLHNFRISISMIFNHIYFSEYNVYCLHNQSYIR